MHPRGSSEILSPVTGKFCGQKYSVQIVSETSLFLRAYRSHRHRQQSCISVWKSPKQLRNHFDDFIEAPVAEMTARHLPLSVFSKANDFSTLIRRHTEKL
jgi:hypothetical protein